MTNIARKFLLVSAAILLVMVGNVCAEQPTKIFVVKKTIPQKSLYFSGIIKPYKKYTVVSPAEGIIAKKYFTFGQRVKKGDVLFLINSLKQQQDYQTALVEYLKAKQTMRNSEAKYKTDTNFWKKDIISHDEYIKSRSTYLLNKLSYMQAQSKLTHIAGDKQNTKELDKLSLDNINSVANSLQLNKTSRSILVRASSDGVALFADDNKVKLGSSVKDNQVLLYIGSKKQLTTDIEISEINVNQLHVGQAVVISGDAFPNLKLHGYISSISAQATAMQGQPAFSAQIVTPPLTAQQKTIIKIGMSIKIMIPTSRTPQIMVPISAVDPDSQTVQVVDPKNKNISKVKVELGETTLNDVVIVSGLKEGDQIIVPDSTK